MTLDSTVMSSISSLRMSRSQVLQRACRVMMLVFWLFVLGSFFPAQVRSPEWGFQLSNTILNVGLLPWLVLVLRRLGLLVEQSEQLEGMVDCPSYLEAPSYVDAPSLDDAPSLLPVEQAEEEEEASVIRGGDIRSLSRAGFWLLILLAAWQVVLFGISLRELDARQAAQVNQIDQQFNQLEQRIRRLPESNQQAALQQLGLDLPDFDPGDPLASVKKSRSEVQLEALKKFNDFRFLLARESVRNFLLAAVYSAGYYGLARI
jgi:hypothetical protein